MKTILKNPFLNSLFAEAYIILIACFIHFFGKPNTPDTIFDSITALSIFTLSPAVMGYLFLGGPLQLYISGQKKEAVSFLVKTILGFAIITVVVVLVMKLAR